MHSKFGFASIFWHPSGVKRTRLLESISLFSPTRKLVAVSTKPTNFTCNIKTCVGYFLYFHQMIALQKL